MHKFKPFIIPVAAAIVVAGGISFFAGMKYGRSKIGIFSDSQNSRAGELTRRGMRPQGNFVAGEVIAKDDKSITVSIRDGGSKIVFFSGATQVMKSAAGSLQDLAPGEQVVTMGSVNSDGSITAQSIQIRPSSPTNNQNK